MQTKTEDEGARSFTRSLEMVAEGELVSEASDELHRLISALQDEALNAGLPAKGEFALKLKIVVEPNGVAAIAYDVKIKEPEPRRPRGHLFVTKGGNLTAHNPKQQKLPLHEVTIGRDVREVDDAGARGAKEIG